VTLINQDLTITSENGAALTTITCASNDTSIITLNGTASNSTLSLSLINLTFSDCVSEEVDGVIVELLSKGKLSVEGVAFERNEGRTGSCISIHGADPKESELIIKNSKFINNTASSVAAVRLWATKYSIDDSIFTGNSASVKGGALYVGEYATGTINFSTFSRNVANDYGGAISVHAGTCIIYGSHFEENSASYKGKSYGGAISAVAGDLRLKNTTLLSNHAFTGGGIYCARSACACFEQTYLSKNTALNGGGIFASEAIVNTTTTMFVENIVSSNGGALACIIQSKCNISSTKIINNTAIRGGGMSIQSSSELYLHNNNVFDGNVVTRLGGGIFCEQSHIEIDSTEMKNNRHSSSNDVSDVECNIALIGPFGACEFSGSQAHLYSKTCTSKYHFNHEQWIVLASCIAGLLFLGIFGCLMICVWRHRDKTRRAADTTDTQQNMWAAVENDSTDEDVKLEE